MQWKRLFTWLVSLSARPAKPLLVLNLIGFTSLPAHRIIQTSSSHPPALARDPSSSFYYKACLPQILLVHPIPEYNPCVALHDVWCLPLPGCEYMWLITCCQSHLSGVGYSVISYYLGWGIPPSAMGWVGGDWNRTANREEESSPGTPERRILGAESIM